MEKSSVYDQLKNAPRKSLLNILIKMHIPFDNTSDNTLYADLIQKELLNKNRAASWNDFNQLNNICYRLFFISLFCAFMLTLVLAIVYFWPRQTNFCDSSSLNFTNNRKCVRCPLFANCSEGSCKCNLNYTRVKNYCIFNDNDKNLVYKMIINEYEILKERAGSYYCQTLEIDWMSDKELAQILFKTSKLDTSNFYRIYGKTLNYLHQDPNIFTSTINNSQVFVSKEMKISVDCKIKQYFSRRFNFLIMISISLMLLSVILSIYRKSKKENIIASRYSNFLIDHLKKAKGARQSKNQLIHNLNSVSNNNGQKLWPRVEKQLRRSHHIQSFNDGYCLNYRYI